MSASQAIIHYGNFGSPLLTAEGYTRRRDGLDAARFTVIDNSSESYPANSKYNGFTILEDDVQRIGDVWEHNLNCVGIKGGKSNLKIKRSVNTSLEGFDTASESWIAANQNQVNLGDRLQGYSNMVCESVQPEELEVAGWYRIQASFRGIATNNKPVKRTISANVDISVVEDLVLLGNGGGGRSAQKWAIAWPKVTVTFSYVRVGTGLKNMPEQGGTPAGPLPTIQTALSSLPSTTPFTWNWPNGWRLVAQPQDEIPGTSIAFTQEVWEWQQKLTV